MEKLVLGCCRRIEPEFGSLNDVVPAGDALSRECVRQDGIDQRIGVGHGREHFDDIVVTGDKGDGPPGRVAGDERGGLVDPDHIDAAQRVKDLGGIIREAVGIEERVEERGRVGSPMLTPLYGGVPSGGNGKPSAIARSASMPGAKK